MKARRKRTDAAYVPWADRAFVTVGEAAQIMGQPTDWVWLHIDAGILVTVGFEHGGGIGVTTASVKALIAAIENAPNPTPGIRRAPRLRLVVDNTGR